MSLPIPWRLDQTSSRGVEEDELAVHSREIPMKTNLLAVTASAVFLACAALPGSTQQLSTHSGQQQAEEAPDQDITCGGTMGRHGMGMGRGTMGGMMHHGMGHRPMMNPLAMRMIFALIDSDGDGTISLQEWQAAHEKIFKAMDPDKDGTVSFEEMMNFMHGSGRPQRAPSAR
jgi:hypothetical protein